MVRRRLGGWHDGSALVRAAAVIAAAACSRCCSIYRHMAFRRADVAGGRTTVVAAYVAVAGLGWPAP